MAEQSGVVTDNGQASWSDLWKKEDYWAIWLGFAILIAAIFIFINGPKENFQQRIDQIGRAHV